MGGGASAWNLLCPAPQTRTKSMSYASSRTFGLARNWKTPRLQLKIEGRPVNGSSSGYHGNIHGYSPSDHGVSKIFQGGKKEILHKHTHTYTHTHNKNVKVVQRVDLIRLKR